MKPEHCAAGQIFITADINDTAEFVYAGMPVQVNRSVHPFAIDARVHAARIAGEAIIAVRPINALRFGGDTGGGNDGGRLAKSRHTAI